MARGAETREDGGTYPPNNLTMVCICIPPNNFAMVRMLALDDLWTFSLVFILFREFGNKNSLIFGEDRFLFFFFTWFRGQKLFNFWWRPFFWSSLHLFTWKKKWPSFIHLMLKIGQYWGKIANYPPNAQHKSAPLVADTIVWAFTFRCLRDRIGDLRVYFRGRWHDDCSFWRIETCRKCYHKIITLHLLLLCR